MTHNGSIARSCGSRPSDLTSSSLVERAKAREPEAWQRLADLYTPLIYHWCRRANVSAQDATDVVQDVFQSVVRGIDDFRGRPSQGAFLAWLRAITRSRAIDFFRKCKEVPQAQGGSTAPQRFREIPDLPQSLDATDVPAAEEVQILWHSALELVRAEFEQRTWRAFWRTVVDDQRPVEAAEELGMTVHAVYKARARVLSRVRQAFSDLEDQGGTT